MLQCGLVFLIETGLRRPHKGIICLEWILGYGQLDENQMGGVVELAVAAAPQIK
jgi:hypothetical protein